MAASISSITGLFDPYTRDQAPTYNVMAKAILGVGSLAERLTAQAQLNKEGYDFVVVGRADVSAETIVLVDLSTRGVTFPAGFMRSIEVETWVTGNGAGTTVERGHFLSRFTLIGGTPPLNALDLPINISTNTTAAAWTTSDPSVTISISGNLVRLLFTNEGAAEINNFTVKVYVKKLVAFVAGV